MEKVKMSAEEMALLDSLDQYLSKVSKVPPEIPLYRFQAILFNSICEKVKQGMLPGRIDPRAKTYRNVPIRCQI